MAKPKTITLRKAECLPIMQAAFKAGELQLQRKGVDGGCFYTGPCVIGACLTPAQRKRFDRAIELYEARDTDIESLIRCGAVKTDDDRWFAARQRAHDRGDVRALGRLLGIKEAR